MSLETFVEDFRRSSSEEDERIRTRDKLEKLEKFFDRILDIVKAYEDEEQYKNIIEDIKWEISNIEEEL